MIEMVSMTLQTYHIRTAFYGIPPMDRVVSATQQLNLGSSL